MTMRVKGFIWEFFFCQIFQFIGALKGLQWMQWREQFGFCFSIWSNDDKIMKRTNSLHIFSTKMYLKLILFWMCYKLKVNCGCVRWERVSCLSLHVVISNVKCTQSDNMNSVFFLEQEQYCQRRHQRNKIGKIICCSKHWHRHLLTAITNIQQTIMCTLCV